MWHVVNLFGLVGQATPGHNVRFTPGFAIPGGMLRKRPIGIFVSSYLITANMHRINCDREPVSDSRLIWVWHASNKLVQLCYQLLFSLSLSLNSITQEHLTSVFVGQFQRTMVVVFCIVIAPAQCFYAVIAIFLPGLFKCCHIFFGGVAQGVNI